MSVKSKEKYAKAFASAFVADIERAPSIKRALIVGRLDRHGLANMVYRNLRVQRGDPDGVLFPNVRKLLHESAKVEMVQAGMGQWAELATSLISTAAGVAAKAYTARTQAETAKKLAELEVQRETAAIRTAELQAQAARLQYARAEAAAGGSSQPEILGIPWWGIGLGVLGLGGIGYILLRPKSRSRR